MKVSEKFYAWSLALYPWLSNYATFVDGLSVGDLLFLVNILFFLGNAKQKIKLFHNANFHLMFYAYCFLSTAFMAMIVDFSAPMVLKRFIKFGLFVFTIFLAVNGYCDKKTFCKAFKFIARVSCVAIVIQYMVFYTLGYYIEFKIPFLKYCNDVVESLDYNASALISFRPHSIFLEPAHFTYFICTYLVFVLFYKGEKTSYKRVIEGLLVTVCMIISVSSTAVLLSMAIWLVYLVKVLVSSDKSFLSKHKITTILLVIVVASVFINFYLKTPQLSYSLFRLLPSENATLSDAVWSRLDSGEIYVNNLSGITAVLGMGFGNLPSASSYFTSYNYLLYCTGYVGLAIILLWGISVMVKGKFMSKMLVFIFLSLCSSSPIIISGYFVLYNVLIYIDDMKEYA